MVNNFEKEIEVIYKGETYSVRDNGAVLRHPHIGSKSRPIDNVWTFGKYNTKTGYAEIGGERVHRIVATAFHGVAPTPQHVVDHIDTNRRNNRPENLRWITKLENILLNPITVKRIVLACGSIEEFLKDPSKLRQSYVDQDFEWMRAVSKEEAAISLERMLSWARSDALYSGGSLGEWIYKRGLPKKNLEPVKTTALVPNDALKVVLSEGSTTKQQVQEVKSSQNTRSNPFNFPRPDKQNIDNIVLMYKTREELYALLKSQFKIEKKLMLPNVVFSTSGKGIIIKEAWTEEFLEVEYCYKGRARTPKAIILHCRNYDIAVLIRIKSNMDKEEIASLKHDGFNIVEIDLSWAKDGITEEEMKHILLTDVTKKKWLYHEQMPKTKEMLLKVCEPIRKSGQGVLHSYVACPLYSDSVQNIDCWYCDYHIFNEKIVEGESYDCECCFGKSRVKTYQDLLSIVNVEKEGEWIVGITYNKNGKIVTEKFSKEVQLPGKTLFQLWNEKVGDKLIAHNIYSDWYVLLELDPQKSFEENGNVYGKLGRSVMELNRDTTRSIFSFDSCCWEIVK